MPRLASRKAGSSFGGDRPRWHINNALKSFDSFGKEVPAFNIKGESRVNTALGGLLTCAILTVSLIYSVIKIVQMVNGDNPIISDLMLPSHYGPEDKLNLNEINFRLAFSIEGFVIRERKDDPRYVKWFVRLYGKKNETRFETHIPFHTCTDEDYDSFYPIIPRQVASLERIRASKKSKMVCIDWDDDSLPF